MAEAYQIIVLSIQLPDASVMLDGCKQWKDTLLPITTLEDKLRENVTTLMWVVQSLRSRNKSKYIDRRVTA